MPSCIFILYIFFHVCKFLGFWVQKLSSCSSSARLLHLVPTTKSTIAISQTLKLSESHPSLRLSDSLSPNLLRG
ncbi:hypothetical protein RchiOBHm_Chr7g0205981 [Rosa chinensis]|uniref:Uncharacterized protein n=1 Tax=Rosa chinensis TaxID=74649 RepID=A0A2P6P941_ROSCH|nr:hypothetical protein RchiOBHm_Chr7g0205981 [Rosa chinensis]